MKSSYIIKKELSFYKENELIFASKLYKDKLCEIINEAAFYKMLERMCNKGELLKVSKGIYCIPRFTEYGIIPPSENEIIDEFTKNNTGLIVGYYLYNHLNLTTQVSKDIQILTSSIDGNTKSIKNINLRQMDIEYTKEIKNMICSLEVLQDFNNIQDINYYAFLDYSKILANNYSNEIFDTVINKKTYKKSTISFLKEVLNYYNIPNHLEKYLSSLSSYKHPRMEVCMSIKDFAKKTAIKVVKKAAINKAERVVLSEVSYQMDQRSSENLAKISIANYKMTIKQKGMMSKLNYVVYDGNSNLKYKIKIDSISIGKESIRLYENNNEIAKIKPITNFRKISHYSVIVGDCEIGTIENNKTIKYKVNFDYKNWTIEGNFLRNEYSVYDRTGFEVIKIMRTSDNNDTYLVEIDDIEDELMALLIFMTIKLGSYLSTK